MFIIATRRNRPSFRLLNDRLPAINFIDRLASKFELRHGHEVSQEEVLTLYREEKENLHFKLDVAIGRGALTSVFKNIFGDAVGIVRTSYESGRKRSYENISFHFIPSQF